MPQLKLPLDYEPSDNDIVVKQAREAVEDGEFSHFDHAYEILWDLFDCELEGISDAPSPPA